MTNSQTYSEDPWRIFRILAEFVDGFETMTSLGPSVSFFGSASEIDKNSSHYKLTVEIAKKIAEKGFGIITGGGFGLMEAANKGAQEGGGKSCGLCINLPKERPNKYIDHEFLLSFRYFFVRKVMFVKYTQGFVVLPGGFGTMDEFFEALTLIHTHKITKFPIFLVGKDYWQGLIDWLNNTALAHKKIEKEYLDIITMTDDADEIANKVLERYEKTKALENF